MSASPSLRIIADVHGQPDMLTQAAGDGANILLLGDLVDNGPDSPGALRLALDWIEAGRARLVRSNHDDKLHRALLGRDVRVGNTLGKTLEDLKSAKDSEALIKRFMKTFEATPYFICHGKYVMAHGAIPAKMFDGGDAVSDPGKGDRRLALYG